MGLRLKLKLILARSRIALLATLLLLVVGAAAQDRGNDSKEPLAFAAIGDTGIGKKPQFDVARQMKIYRDKIRFDFVLMLGDNIYPNGRADLFKQHFEQPYDELLKAGVKFYAVLGNHDVMRGTQAQTRYDKFNMGGHRYYSFTKGDGLAEFFALDSNAMTQEQLSWVEGALKSSDARWKIVYMHHPIYSSGRNRGSDPKLRGLLEPLFIRFKVDVVFAGHSHVYERTKPQNGIHYLISGAGGKLGKGDLNRKSSFFEAGNDSVNSFLIARIAQDQISIQAVGSDGTILDTVSIAKDR